MKKLLDILLRRKPKRLKKIEGEKDFDTQFEIIINNFCNHNLLDDCAYIATRYNEEYKWYEAYGRYKLLHPHELILFSKCEAGAIASVLGLVSELVLQCVPNSAFIKGIKNEDELLYYTAILKDTKPNLNDMRKQYYMLRANVRQQRGKDAVPEWLIEHRKRAEEDDEKAS